MLHTLCVCLGETSPGSSQTDPSLLAVFYDYIKLMPMMAEANQMSQELNKVASWLMCSYWRQIFLVMDLY